MDNIACSIILKIYMEPIDKGIVRKIRRLRATGHSISEISKECRISPATASRYIRGIAIEKRHLNRWLERRNASKIISERNWGTARIAAEQNIKNLNDKDLRLFITALYWAEGAKKDFSFFNSDPRMIRIFVRILKKIFSVKDADFKISIRIYEDLNRESCLRYWSRITGIRLGGDTSVEAIKGKKRGKLEFGMCRVRIRRGGLLLKEFSATIERVISLFNEEKPS